MLPPFRYYGAKHRIAPQIVPLIPQLPLYAEPYAGSAAILLCPARPRARVEILNDLYGDVINIWRYLQDPKRFEELKHRLTYTPYSQADFALALEMLNNQNTALHDRAWAFFVAMNQGFCGFALTPGQWRRESATIEGMARNVNTWANRVEDSLDYWHKRMFRVQLYCMDALDFIRAWDGPNTSFFIDPPYLLGTRKCAAYGIHECTTAHYKELIQLLLTLKAAVVLCGYAAKIYLPLVEAGWQRKNILTYCTVKGTASARVETVWRNQRAVYLTRNRRTRSSLLCATTDTEEAAMS